MTSKELFEKAKALRDEADAVSKQACDLHTEELKAKPLFERMVFASDSRCHCGAGMAYDPVTNGIHGKWECSDIIRYETFDDEKKKAVKAAEHTGAMPFAFYEVKAEGQPSAYGRTTRPKE